MKLYVLGIIAASGTALAQGVELTPLTIGLVGPTGLDFHGPSGSLVVATDGANSLAGVAADGSSTTFSSATGYTGDRVVETVRAGALAFTPGDVFTTNGRPGEIVRIGEAVIQPTNRVVDDVDAVLDR